ncbi:hypothetical protein [Pseudalkalibacillus caeni]|uniref:Uncharacterized protein n=1 Tax=Exobacillus caeni TaxID=2574798 RepID=A0A5R9F0E5_9BACL|nr:hypothetical protein [Pseudalkalibacillus caeni]TLS37082.1 hypothetical protein FCL54_11170 [Pseudalkalibacillus caeni]
MKKFKQVYLSDSNIVYLSLLFIMSVIINRSYSGIIALFFSTAFFVFFLSFIKQFVKAIWLRGMIGIAGFWMVVLFLNFYVIEGQEKTPYMYLILCSVILLIGLIIETKKEVANNSESQ